MVSQVHECVPVIFISNNIHPIILYNNNNKQLASIKHLLDVKDCAGHFAFVSSICIAFLSNSIMFIIPALQMKNLKH